MLMSLAKGGAQPAKTILNHRFYCGDAKEVLRCLPEASVDCVITSPPYWALRDYGVSGQIGLEDSPEEFTERLILVFEEVWRVLKPTGSCWVNMGDTYWAGGSSTPKSNDWRNYAGSSSLIGRCTQGQSERPVKSHIRKGWKRPKQLLLIPSRFAIAMQEAGWLLRNDVIWHKKNAMPGSQLDRLTNRYEHLFHFVKKGRYYYDLDAIRVPWESDELCKRWGRKSKVIPEFGTIEYRHWYHEQRKKRSWHDHQNDELMGFGQQKRGQRLYTNLPHPEGKNPGDVWEICTEAFAGAHFATFPAKLVEPCILATASPVVCPTCGVPWERVREKTGHVNRREIAHVPNNTPTKSDSTGWAPTSRGTVEFSPSCECPDNEGSNAGVVLDPFGGSGTTSLVAARLGRNSIYIDLNPEYLQMAIRRLQQETEQLNFLFEHRIDIVPPDQEGNHNKTKIC